MNIPGLSGTNLYVAAATLGLAVLGSGVHFVRQSDIRVLASDAENARTRLALVRESLEGELHAIDEASWHFEAVRANLLQLQDIFYAAREVGQLEPRDPVTGEHPIPGPTPELLAVRDEPKLPVRRSQFRRQLANSDFRSLTYSLTDHRLYLKEAIDTPPFLNTEGDRDLWEHGVRMAKHVIDRLEKTESLIPAYQDVLAESLASRERLNRATVHQRTDRGIAIILIIIGVGISGTGFGLWYARTQRLSDSILRDQASRSPD